MHPVCCSSSFQLPLSLVAQPGGGQVGFVRWLGVFKCHGVSSFDGVKRNSRPCLIEFAYRNISGVDKLGP